MFKGLELGRSFAHSRAKSSWFWKYLIPIESMVLIRLEREMIIRPVFQKYLLVCAGS